MLEGMVDLFLGERRIDPEKARPVEEGVSEVAGDVVQVAAGIELILIREISKWRRFSGMLDPVLFDLLFLLQAEGCLWMGKLPYQICHPPLFVVLDETVAAEHRASGGTIHIEGAQPIQRDDDPVFHFKRDIEGKKGARRRFHVVSITDLKLTPLVGSQEVASLLQIEDATGVFADQMLEARKIPEVEDAFPVQVELDLVPLTAESATDGAVIAEHVVREGIVKNFRR
jgi:hypothetical protein